METRVAVIGIIVENMNSVSELNSILSGYGDRIVGRMGIPYRQKNVNIISVVLDAPLTAINGLSGKLGMIEGVSSKVLTAK